MKPPGPGLFMEGVAPESARCPLGAPALPCCLQVLTGCWLLHRGPHPPLPLLLLEVHSPCVSEGFSRALCHHWCLLSRGLSLSSARLRSLALGSFLFIFVLAAPGREESLVTSLKRTGDTLCV